MKTNKMMRVASLLLIVVLLSTCAISSTFAKYTSTDFATDNARVAYWGFGSDMVADIDLFDGDYTDVVSKDGVNVVAPGTAKTAQLVVTYTAKGDTKAPEVAYQYDVVAEATSTSDYAALDANQNFKWTLKIPGADAAVEYNTVAELVNAINATTQTLDSNKLPEGYDETTLKATYEIGWKWVFTGDATYADGATSQDQYDTAMGNDTTPDDVTIKIKITATQLDTTPIA